MASLLSSSLSRSDEKLIRSLALKKFRDKEGLFVVEGDKMVEEALSSSLETIAVYRTDQIGEERMNRISSLSSPSPALAVIRIPQNTITDYFNGLSLVLDGIRDPGNLGTILRLCDWFGIERIYASTDTTDIFSPKAVQSSMGAIFRKQIIYSDLAVTLKTFRENGIPVYGTFLSGENIHNHTFERNNACIVMGNESRGISDSLIQFISDRLFIPPYPAGSKTSESLNVAVATSIICYEFRRPL